MKVVPILCLLFATCCVYAQNNDPIDDTQTAQVLFASGKYDLNPIAKRAIAAIAQQKLRYYEVSGYADAQGDSLNNMRLSENRAQSVAAYLATQGVDSKVITVNSFGENSPFGDNVSTTGKAKNRRVTLTGFNKLLTSWKDLEEKPQFFMISNKRDTTITGKKGTIIDIPAHALKCDPNKSVRIVLKEYYSKYDMLFNKMTTRADNELLESGGMFYIGAEQGGKALTAVAPLTYKFPKNGNEKSDFQLFKGIKDKNGDLNWRLSNAPAKADRAANDLDNIISGTSDFKGSIGLAGDNKNGRFMYSASAILDVTQSEGLKYVVDITPKVLQTDKDIRNQINNILFMKHNEKLRYKETKGFDKGICTFKITTAGDFVDIVSKMNDPYFDDIMQKTFEGAHAKQKSSKMDKIFTVTILFSPADIWNREEQLYNYLTAHPEDSTFSEKMRNEFFEKRKSRRVNAGLKELAQNTTAAGVVNSSASATHYLFTSSQLGWANCDRFTNMPSTKVTLAVTNLAAPTTMSVIFKNIKTMVGSTYSINDKAGIGSCVSARLPEGEPISIVALQERDGIPYIAIMETKVSDTPIADLQFSLATPDKLRKIKEMLE